MVTISQAILCTKPRMISMHVLLDMDFHTITCTVKVHMSKSLPGFDGYFAMILCFILFYETDGRQANAKAQEVVDHLTNFLSSREETSQPGFEPPTSSIVSTIIQ